MTNTIGRGIKVLVAEDDIEYQDSLKTYLEILGCSVDIAKNGMEAVEKIGEKEYNICFMDIRMPLMGGLEATDIIRKQEQSEIPIIAMTDEVTDDDFKDCLDAQMNDLITKPFDIVKLKKIIFHFGKKQNI